MLDGPSAAFSYILLTTVSFPTGFLIVNSFQKFPPRVPFAVLIPLYLGVGFATQLLVSFLAGIFSVSAVVPILTAFVSLILILYNNRTQLSRLSRNFGSSNLSLGKLFNIGILIFIALVFVYYGNFVASVKWPPAGDAVVHSTYTSLAIFQGHIPIDFNPLRNELADYPLGYHVFAANISLLSNLYPGEVVFVNASYILAVISSLLFTLTYLFTRSLWMSIPVVFTVMIQAPSFNLERFLFGFLVNGPYPNLFGFAALLLLIVLFQISYINRHSILKLSFITSTILVALFITYPPFLPYAVLFLVVYVACQELMQRLRINDNRDPLMVDEVIKSTPLPEDVLGIIVEGKFISVETSKTLCVTTVRREEGRHPESGELEFTQYEGRAVLVRCLENDGHTLWGSEILEVAGPILTSLIKKKHRRKIRLFDDSAFSNDNWTDQDELKFTSTANPIRDSKIAVLRLLSQYGIPVLSVFLIASVLGGLVPYYMNMINLDLLERRSTRPVASVDTAFNAYLSDGLFYVLLITSIISAIIVLILKAKGSTPSNRLMYAFRNMLDPKIVPFSILFIVLLIILLSGALPFSSPRRVITFFFLLTWPMIAYAVSTVGIASLRRKRMIKFVVIAAFAISITYLTYPHIVKQLDAPGRTGWFLTIRNNFMDTYDAAVWIYNNVAYDQAILNDRSYSSLYINGFKVQNLTHSYWSGHLAPMPQELNTIWMRPTPPPEEIHELLRKYDIEYILVTPERGYYDHRFWGGTNEYFSTPYPKNNYISKFDSYDFLEREYASGNAVIYRVH